MGHSQAEKAQSRERILAHASKKVRADGLESLNIAEVMQSAGLTHGGFYGHFKSRAELQAEALKSALKEMSAKRRAASFREGVMSYLSLRHRDRPATGCAMAALVSEVRRADDDTRRAMEVEIEAVIARMKPDFEGGEHHSMVVLSTMVGALALSRIMTDDERAEALLKAARDHVIAMGPSEDEGRSSASEG